MIRIYLFIAISVALAPAMCRAQLVKFDQKVYKPGAPISLTVVHTQPQNQSAVIVTVFPENLILTKSLNTTAVFSGKIPDKQEPTIYYFKFTFSGTSRYYQLLVLPKTYSLAPGMTTISERIPFHVTSVKEEFKKLSDVYDKLNTMTTLKTELQPSITKVVSGNTAVTSFLTTPPSFTSAVATGLLVGYCTFKDAKATTVLIGGQYGINHESLKNYYGSLLDSLQKEEGSDEPRLYPTLKVLAMPPLLATFKAPKSPNPSPNSSSRYPVVDWDIYTGDRGFRLTILKNMSF